VRVLIVAEGIHELGSAGVPKRGEERDHAGALQTLIQRLLPGEIEFIQRAFKSRDVQPTAMPGMGSKLRKRILQWFRYAERHECDAIIILIDEDDDPRRGPDMESAQDQLGIQIRRACGLAIRVFDAWIIADEAALSAALGSTVDCQRAPEEIRKPKRVFKNIHEASACELWPRDVYALVMEKVNLELLAKRCPRGFALFEARVRALAQ
jgi:hypothetical protein